MADKRIPALRKGDNSVHWLSLRDICYVALDDRNIVYHTAEDEFIHPGKLEDIALALRPEGFEKLDRGVLVQLRNIKKFDSLFGKMYFSSEVTEHTKYATLSPLYQSKLRMATSKHNDISK